MGLSTYSQSWLAPQEVQGPAPRVSAGTFCVISGGRHPIDGFCRQVFSLLILLLGGHSLLGAPLLEQGVRTGSGKMQICDSHPRQQPRLEIQASVCMWGWRLAPCLLALEIW